MTVPYSYNCTDKSILLPYYKKFYVTPWFRLIPAWLTANFITIISTGFVAGMLVASIWMDTPGSSIQALIFAFCLHAYLLGDHLDGMQAKKSMTSSPLGEFMDHYLDVYNGAIVFYTLVIFLGPIPGNLFLLLMILNCMAFAATMVEELECRMLFFGYIGTLEGVLLLTLFYISWMVPEIREFWQREYFPGYPASWVAVIILGLGYLVTIVDILIRMRRVPRPFAVYCGFCIILAWLLSQHQISQIWSWLLLTLFSGDYIARVMRGYLLSQPHPYPSIPSSLFLLLALAVELTGWAGDAWWGPFSVILTTWLTIRVLYAFGETFYQLREHWLWVNPV